MYTLTLVFANGKSTSYQHISKVKYYEVNAYVEVSGEEIFTHDFPLSTPLQLFSPDKTYKISCDDLKSIEVEKEKD